MAVVPRLTLTPATAAALLEMYDSKTIEVEFLRTENHAWRITDGRNGYFLKAHTKDWYRGSAEIAGDVVGHEVAGYAMLREAGLASVEVVASSTSTNNPFGWPYLITRELTGAPLVDVLTSRADEKRADVDAVMRAVGRYLAGMHAPRFEHPGYLRSGPPGPPTPGGSVHWVSRLERFVLYLGENLAADRETVDLATRDRVASLLIRTLPALREAYRPPRFVHGDCHPNTFFLAHKENRWHVTGVVDMETCSAGCPLFDFAKLMIVLAGYLGGRWPWWEPLFDAYGEEPDLETMRLVLVGHAHRIYTLGDHRWPGSRQEILRHLLTARGWQELLDVDRIGDESPTR